MFNKLMDYAAKKEMRESRDEVVIGQIIASMARRATPRSRSTPGTPLDTGYQSILFATPTDPVLHTVQVTLDRKTGGGSSSARSSRGLEGHVDGARPRSRTTSRTRTIC